MSINNISLTEWNKFDKAEAQKYAEALVSRIPQKIVFDGLKTSYYADQEILLAQYKYNGALFSLIPGGSIKLGFDPDQFMASENQLESFQETAEEYGFEDLATTLMGFTTPLRTVTLPTMLVETSPHEIGLEVVDTAHPEIQELIKEYPDSVEVYKKYRINKLKDGSMEVWKITASDHHSIINELNADGLRLLTSDEWEYVCGAGSRTLFRWGNDCPCDRYPIDNSADEVRRKKEWVLSGGKIPFTADEPDWDLHLSPNLFGLTIATNPYKTEVVAEKGVVRGGDGGSSICGGVGFFFGWIPLATAYADPNATEWLEEDLSNNFYRRVIPC